MNDQMTCFGILRHAMTLWNRERRLQGHKDSPLLPEGELQARRWGEMLSACEWDRILASDLGRARHTAELLNERLHLPLYTDSRLREKNWGQWTGMTIAEIHLKFGDMLPKLEQSGWDFRPPGGEDRREVWQRSREAMHSAACKWPGENVLVVTHEGVIKCLLYRLLNRDFLPSEEKILKTGHLHRLVADGDNLAIGKLNALSLIDGELPVNIPASDEFGMQRS